MAPPAAAVTSVASTGTGGVVWHVWPGHELHLRTPPRWRHRWTGRRQPEVFEDGLDRAAFDEERDHHPATATAVALEHLLAEDPAQQRKYGRMSCQGPAQMVGRSPQFL